MEFAPPPMRAADTAAVTAHVEALIDEAMEFERDQQVPRDYLGGSRLGEACDRKLAYEFHKAKVDPGREFSGRTLRLFDRGHDNEARMAARLRAAGFNLITHKPDGGQIGWGVAPDPETGVRRIGGHLDGVIIGFATPEDWPDIATKQSAWAASLPFPLLWENKCLNSKSTGDVVDKGLATSKPVYWSQIHTYMAQKGLSHTLFTIENADNGKIWADLIPFDPSVAREALERGFRVIKTTDPTQLPRIGKVQEDFRCKFCSFQARCWSEPAAPKAAPTHVGGWSPFGPQRS
jgi:hypothetical protein